jgi:regulator of protease activity HflC (stomatin/prohibitin superfamily)
LYDLKKGAKMHRSMLSLTAIVADDQRAILRRDGRFVRILPPGRHSIFDPFNRLTAEIMPVARAEFPRDAYLALAAADRKAAEAHFTVVETKASEVAIVSFDGQPAHVLGPWTTRVFWSPLTKVTADKIDAAASTRLSAQQWQAFHAARGAVPAASAVVEAHELGILFQNGEVGEILKPGAYAFWAVDRQIRIAKYDMRPQTLEITAQEILTKDRVSVRVTLTAFWRYVDLNAALANTVSAPDALYKITQFAIREAVASRTLDDILGARDRLDAEVSTAVVERTKTLGLAVEEFGVKDVILPGEIRELINKVVEAERTAKANLIRRQEETAATRSLLNTAKLMEDNKLLLRLKELEALEKLVEKVGRIDLHAAGEGQGLEAILRGLFRFETGAPAAK